MSTDFIFALTKRKEQEIFFFTEVYISPEEGVVIQ